MLQVVAGHEEEIALHRRWWGENRVDGVILVDLHAGDRRVAELERLGVPAVVLGHPSEAGGLVSVWTDEEEAVRGALDHLVALGHRRIARVAGPPQLVHTALRDRAFDRLAREAGAAPHAVVHTDYTGEGGARATRRLLSPPDRPTAIVYDNDLMAVAGLSVAAEMGMRVPEEVSVVAWDDSALCSLVRPALTALSRDVAACGAYAARTLLELIDGGEAAGLRSPAPRLVARGSTAPPAGRTG
jgi:DNA-binding LacI/PurR family transcriptional regulator